MKWISEWLFKEHIENMVEEKFQEKLLETYLHQRQQEHKARIAQARKALDNKTSRVSQEEQPKLQSSSRVRTGSAKSKSQESTSAAAMKAKLLGKKK
jgi:hypothetical protein